MNAWRTFGASVLGRDHAALRKNRQDAFTCGAKGSLAYGVVCDGCGQGARSEVGAGLASAIVGAALARALASGAPLATIPGAAADALVHSFGELARAVAGDDAAAHERLVGFVADHLLATVVGFCIRGDEGLAFACGDGAIILGDEMRVFDEDDRPSYPAYRLVGRDVAMATKPFSTAVVHRIAIATDGFDAELLPEAFGRRGSALARWMNVRSRGGHFRDDATIVVAERATDGDFDST